MMLVYAIPSVIVGAIAGTIGWDFTDWQHWACLLPVSIATAVLYVSHG